jgi:tetratricopeptide (TPR) repeat protein/tRNA A-37 threonylcarbamoyl transferase component Bud32
VSGPDATKPPAPDRAAAALAETLRDDSQHAAQPRAGADVFPGAPPPGATIGRFEVLGVLGAGGMGVVLAARDPHLDRRVALKVLRPGVWRDGAAESTGRARLVREAKAMARLAHPNVVAVHEVSLEGPDGTPFIVMEHVDGRTIRAWLHEAPRSRREILELYLQAGAGLAAAHRAGLVHRDFKPDNVLVGRDGRARVGDFGIVVPVAAVDPAAPAGTPGGSPLTHTVSWAGTPRYASPEQLLGMPTDARGDQYSFCVSLYEALTGVRPFTGETVGELLDNIHAGRLQPPPEGTAPLAPYLRAALVRGLAADPAARHPSMEALFVALQADPARRRRRVLLGAAAVLAVGLGGVGLAAGLRGSAAVAPAPCQGAEARLAGVWDDARRAEVRAAFTATGRDHAAETFARVDGALTAYARDWVAMHRDACEATHVRHEQSPTLLDLRMACLGARRSELGALTAAFAAPSSPKLVDGAMIATRGLAPLADCADIDGLTALPPLPAAPEEHARTQELLERLGEVAVFHRLQRTKEGLTLLDELERAAAGLTYPGLRADLAFWRGAFLYLESDYKGAEPRLRESIALASRARDLRREARAWVSLFAVLAMQPERVAEINEVRLAAEAALDRAGRPRAESERFARNLVAMHSQAGRHEEATVAARAALAAAGDDPWTRAASLDMLAKSLIPSGKTDELLVAARESLALWEELLGPDHPRVADVLATIGNALRQRGDFDEADRVLTRALRIQENVLGPEHLDLWVTLKSLAWLSAARGDVEATRRHGKRLVALLEKTAADKPGMILNGVAQYAGALAQAGAYDEAIVELQGALAFAKAHELEQDYRAGIAGLYLGVTLNKAKRWREADAACTTAMPIIAASFGETSDAVGALVLCQGVARLGQKKPARAIIERAYGLIDDGDSEPGELADVRFALARAIVAEGGDRARAIELAKQARAELAAGSKALARDLAEVDAWLAANDKS